MLGTGPAAATAATTTSSNVSVLQQFASGLKSRNEETRAKAAKELQHYVTMELREVGASRIRWGALGLNVPALVEIPLDSSVRD